METPLNKEDGYDEEAHPECGRLLSNLEDSFKVSRVYFGMRYMYVIYVGWQKDCAWWYMLWSLYICACGMMLGVTIHLYGIWWWFGVIQGSIVMSGAIVNVKFHRKYMREKEERVLKDWYGTFRKVNKHEYDVVTRFFDGYEYIYGRASFTEIHSTYFNALDLGRELRERGEFV